LTGKSTVGTQRKRGGESFKPTALNEGTTVSYEQARMYRETKLDGLQGNKMSLRRIMGSVMACAILMSAITYWFSYRHIIKLNINRKMYDESIVEIIWFTGSSQDSATANIRSVSKLGHVYHWVDLYCFAVQGCSMKPLSGKQLHDLENLLAADMPSSSDLIPWSDLVLVKYRKPSGLYTLKLNKKYLPASVNKICNVTCTSIK
jgi:hypothetical protein